MGSSQLDLHDNNNKSTIVDVGLAKAISKFVFTRTGNFNSNAQQTMVVQLTFIYLR